MKFRIEITFDNASAPEIYEVSGRDLSAAWDAFKVRHGFTLVFRLARVTQLKVTRIL